MSKITRRWISRDWTDSNGCLRIADIPYDASNDAKTKIDDALKYLRISSADTTSSYLIDKIVAGNNVTITKLNPGSNESLQLDVTQTTYLSEQITLSVSDIANKQIGLTYTPIGNTSVNVQVGGAPTQLKDVDYTISGSTISWSGKGLESYLATSDVLVVEYAKYTVGGGSSNYFENVFVSSTYTAAAGNKIVFDTSVAAFTITLPANPTPGDEIWFIDGGGAADTKNLTIARNGKNIKGSAVDLTVDVAGASFGMVYFNDTRGWIIE